jgi:uncharacterized membrane protein
VAKETPVTIHRNERILAFMIAAIVGLSILAFLTVIIATAAGLKGSEFTGGFWQFVALLPGVGLPLGFVMIIVLIVIGGRRRSREARDDITTAQSTKNAQSSKNAPSGKNAPSRKNSPSSTSTPRKK